MNRTYDQWKETFVDKVRMRVRMDSDLKDRGNVEVHSICRMNMGPLEGLTMPELTESGLSPIVYLEELYEQHQSGIPEDILVWRTVTSGKVERICPSMRV